MFLHDHVMVSAVAALYQPFVLSDNIIYGIKPDDSEFRPYAPDTYFFGYPILLMILNPDLFTLLFFISILHFKHFVETGRSAHWGRASGYATFGDLTPGNILTGFGFYEPYWLVDFEKFPESTLTSDIGNLKVLILPKFRVNPVRNNHLLALDHIFPSGDVYYAEEYSRLEQ
ncbi:hypothetical protein Ccrd_026891 [Cynara cardunculus var. scolymus]|uniref:Uncharacterized protein n=1 Tax=Cynara cardunculus var. scolymus TaxID=59895 RepID=A0A103XD23_CYNCS|nr:hypothetical protein Ccrd_026891 [Cynara cardunculus var. scolymus]